MEIYAYCWASGLVQFGTIVPAGAIEIAKGEQGPVIDLIEATARHAHDGITLLVPGVPEAHGQAAKGDALSGWLKWLARGSRPGVEITTPRN